MTKKKVTKKDEIHYAILDSKKVLIGYDVVNSPIEDDFHIKVPKNCDLKVGKYVYNFEELKFDPIPKLNSLPFDQKSVKAVYLSIKAIQESGLIELPQEALDWLAKGEKYVTA